jgi:hypothetical protein
MTNLFWGLILLFFFFLSFHRLPPPQTFAPTTWLGARMSYLRVQVSCDRGRRNYRMERLNGMRCNAMGPNDGQKVEAINTHRGRASPLFSQQSTRHSSNANWCQHTARDIHTYTPLLDAVQCLTARIVNTPQNISPEKKNSR